MVSQGDSDGDVGGLDPSHLESDPKEGGMEFAGFGEQKVGRSVLGDIPVEASEEEEVFDNGLNESERDELIALRNRLMEMQMYLEAHGLSMASFEKSSVTKTAGFNNVGLSDPLSEDKAGPSGTKAVEVLSGKDDKQGEEGSKADGINHKKTWYNVVKASSAPKKVLKLDYFPLQPGSNVVSPPDAVLQAGVDKLKLCLEGTFTRGSLPFKLVAEKAKVMWEKSGLLKVSHRDSKHFIFRFDTQEHKMAALSRGGTWYFGSKPMVVYEWGTKVKLT